MLQRLPLSQAESIVVVGQAVLQTHGVILSGEVLLAKSLLASAIADLSTLLAEVRAALPVPITSVVSDGQDTLRKAVAQTLPGVPHQLCHFHYLREAAKPIYEADRHAKKELKKRMRGVQPIERQAEGSDDVEAEIVSPATSSCRVSPDRAAFSRQVVEGAAKEGGAPTLCRPEHNVLGERSPTSPARRHRPRKLAKGNRMAGWCIAAVGHGHGSPGDGRWALTHKRKTSQP